MKNDLTRERKVLQRLYQDLGYFANFFLPEHCKAPFCQMHQDLLSDESSPRQRGRREVIAAPRGYAKTTVKVLFKVLHAILFGYEPYILILCQSEQEAKARVTQIAEELSNNPRIKAVFGSQFNTELGAGSKKSFVTHKGIRVEGKSVGQQIRGLKHKSYRPSLVILDDVELLETVRSETERNKLLDWFNQDVMHVGQTDGTTNFIVIGTCLHPKSLLTTLMKTPGWKARKYQAVSRFSPKESLWKQWEQLYLQLSDPQREHKAEAFWQLHQEEMLADTQVL